MEGGLVEKGEEYLERGRLGGAHAAHGIQIEHVVCSLLAFQDNTANEHCCKHVVEIMWGHAGRLCPEPNIAGRKAREKLIQLFPAARTCRQPRAFMHHADRTTPSCTQPRLFSPPPPPPHAPQKTPSQPLNTSLPRARPQRPTPTHSTWTRTPEARRRRIR